MKMIRYATARLIYYKKQTILYCLFSSFSAFLLIACLTLYHLQSALANQVQDRLSFIGASASTELLPASKAKLFLFIFWQLFFPLFLCCILVLLWIVSFQSIYETLLQRINFLVLKTAELPDIRDILTSVSGLTIPMDQQTFFTIDFQNDLFFTDILRGFAQTLVGLSGCCLILSLFPFTFFIHHLQSRRPKRNET